MLCLPGGTCLSALFKVHSQFLSLTFEPALFLHTSFSPQPLHPLPQRGEGRSLLASRGRCCHRVRLSRRQTAGTKLLNPLGTQVGLRWTLVLLDSRDTPNPAMGAPLSRLPCLLCPHTQCPKGMAGQDCASFQVIAVVTSDLGIPRVGCDLYTSCPTRFNSMPSTPHTQPRTKSKARSLALALAVGIYIPLWLSGDLPTLLPK